MTTPMRPITRRTPAVFDRTIPFPGETCDVSHAIARSVYETLVTAYARMGHDITAHHETYVEQGSDRDAWYGRPVLCRNFDDSPAWAIVWEEGPWEWVYDDFLHTLGDTWGISIEPVNTFSVRLYPL